LGFVIGSGIAGLHAATLLLAGHVQYKLAAKLDLTAVPIILLGYLMLACREELAFHGYPLRRMDSLFGLYVAQVTIAVVFAAEHILGGYSWANAILGAASGSLLFGMASLATRGLAVPIGLHAAWNLGQWVLGSKETPGFYAPVVEEGFRGSFECTSMISYLGIIVIATFLFWAWNRRTVRSAG
jgi:membrane protease YdiL (CAAX protease family)